MKKFSIAMAILAAMVFTACNNNDVVVIRLDETQLEMVKGSTKQLTATIIPADPGAAYEWFSSMPEYVSVSINEEFVESDKKESTVLKEGDNVEFLYFMGGGQ